MNSLLLYGPLVTEIDSNGHERAVTFDKALACAFVSIEKERKKKRSFPFGQSGEDISFIVQILWPFAMLRQPPGKWLAFDSLGILKLNLGYGSIRQCESFSQEMDKATPTTSNVDDFSNLLETHLSTFKNFAGSSTFEFSGFLSEKDVRVDLVEYFRLATAAEPSEALLLSPVVTSQMAEEAFGNLSELRDKAKGDIDTLNKTGQSLRALISKWDAKIKEEEQSQQDHYNSQIAEIAPDVNEKVRKLTEERDLKIAPLEERIDALEAEVRREEEFRAILESQEEDAESELKQARDELEFEESRNQDAFMNGKQRDLYTKRSQAKVDMLERKVQGLEDKASVRSERTEEFSDKVETAREALNRKSRERDNIRRPFDQRISQEKSRITVLEAIRDGKIAELNQKMSAAFGKSEQICQDIANLVKQKELFIGEVVELESTVENPFLKPEKEIYIHVPILLAKLQSEKESRFVVFPPSKMRKGKSAIEKASGFLFETTSVPVEPRNKGIEKLCEVFRDLMKMNHPAIKEVTEKASKFDLLKAPKTKENLSKGMETLHHEGWLKYKHSLRLTPNLRRILLIAVVLSALGIATVVSAALVQIPIEQTVQVNERYDVDLGYANPRTYTLVAGNVTTLTCNLKSGTVIKANMTVSGGSGGDINFYVKDSTGNTVFNPGRVSHIYSYQFVAPKDDQYKVSMDNGFSIFSTKTVIYAVEEAYYMDLVYRQKTSYFPLEQAYPSVEWIGVGLVMISTTIGLLIAWKSLVRKQPF